MPGICNNRLKIQMSRRPAEQLSSARGVRHQIIAGRRGLSRAGILMLVTVRGMEHFPHRRARLARKINGEGAAGEQAL
jgi:hypothetical protein